MSVGISPAVEQTLVLGVFFGLLVARRAYAQMSGTPVSAARLLGYSVLFPLVFALVIGTESFPIVPLWSIGADVAAVAVGTVVALLYVAQRVTLYEVGGRWMYRLNPLIPIVYLALFLARLVLEVAIGVDPFGPSDTPISGGALLVLVGVDALYGFSTGLALGRNVGVYRAWQRAVQAAPAPLRSEPS